MKVIDIFGDNYSGEWNKSRVACRGIIIQNGNFLLSYEKANDQWMIPGGGLEEGESDKECVIREIAEETGLIVQPSECLLEIDEYYEKWKWVNRYFLCEVVETTEINLTDGEKEAGMEARWMPLDDIKKVFSEYDQYDKVDKMRKGMYFREYKALLELVK